MTFPTNGLSRLTPLPSPNDDVLVNAFSASAPARAFSSFAFLNNRSFLICSACCWISLASSPSPGSASPFKFSSPSCICTLRSVFARPCRLAGLDAAVGVDGVSEPVWIVYRLVLWLYW